MSVLPLVIVVIVAAAAVLGGVIVVAMGRGGEMAPSEADVRPLDGDIVTAADVALLRPPAALWGYDMRSTDEALNRVAQTVTERDVEIASLRRQLADMQSGGADPRAVGSPRHAADRDLPDRDLPDRDLPDAGAYPGLPGPAPRPPAIPLRRTVGGPSRPPAGDPAVSPWERPGPAVSPWERPGPAQPDQDEPETGTGGGA